MTDREATLVKLWHDDVPVGDIAARLGISRQHAYKIASQLRGDGVELSYRCNRPDTPPRSPRFGSRLGTPYEQMLNGTWKGEACAA